MLFSELPNKEELCGLIVNELQEEYGVVGIKYRKEKKHKHNGENVFKKKIFNVPLHHLEKTDALLSNGAVTQVPIFVSVTCERILEHVSTVGLFRRAGSVPRQKELKANLERGIPFNRTHHVLDVANILKMFFRELPEPLIPHGNIQETMLRSLMCGENKIRVLMLACLLLPTHSLNTLAYFMQFLQTVARHADENRMTAENLGIIFAPGLMPLDCNNNIRLQNHFKIIQMLIENSQSIGILPESIKIKAQLQLYSNCEGSSSLAVTNARLDRAAADKKKKKRRSGSLTRMFNGLKKIVGGGGQSTDSLDKVSEMPNPMTPCLNKAPKKRKGNDVGVLSAKKKKEVLSVLPQNNGGLLPNTPSVQPKETKRSRLSLGGHLGRSRAPKVTTNVKKEDLQPPMERRWSVVGSGWNRKKHSSVSSLLEVSHSVTKQNSSNDLLSDNSIDSLLVPVQKQEPSSDYEILDASPKIRISKSEYEAIKERVSAIENRISQEFNNIQMTDSLEQSEQISLDGPEKVQNKYNQTLAHTEPISETATSTDQLAKRLSRELKIRRSAEHKVIRSPSARKIGTMRRRSKESVRLSRNLSWHVTGADAGTIPLIAPPTVAHAFYPKSSLKRGRPNTTQTGLRQPTPVQEKTPISTFASPMIEEKDVHQQHWVCANDFFSNPTNDQHNMSIDSTPVAAGSVPTTPNTRGRKSLPNTPMVNSKPSTPAKPSTPRYVTTLSVNEMKTPMLPPRMPISKQKTPGSVKQQPSRVPVADNGLTGRASIARIRSQNAGMVMAKAKLYDGLVTTEHDVIVRRQSSRFAMPKQRSFEMTGHQPRAAFTDRRDLTKLRAIANQQRLTNNCTNSPKNSTPRRRVGNGNSASTKCPSGVTRRQRLRLVHSPTKNNSSPILKKTLHDNFKQSAADVLATNSKVPRRVPTDYRSPAKTAAPLDSTPLIKRPLLIKSPRRIQMMKTPGRENQGRSAQCTPMKATPIKPFHGNNQQRRSPRIVRSPLSPYF